jgi:hypothetical protein
MEGEREKERDTGDVDILNDITESQLEDERERGAC